MICQQRKPHHEHKTHKTPRPLHNHRNIPRQHKHSMGAGNTPNHRRNKPNNHNYHHTRTRNPPITSTPTEHKNQPTETPPSTTTPPPPAATPAQNARRTPSISQTTRPTPKPAPKPTTTKTAPAAPRTANKTTTPDITAIAIGSLTALTLITMLIYWLHSITR